jgi:hypothetical protein
LWQRQIDDVTQIYQNDFKEIRIKNAEADKGISLQNGFCKEATQF